MSSTTANLTNVNFMSEERFDNLSTINDDELYAVKTDLVDKNLANTGYLTNCITEIPQDINLELNNGALTLKTGSKVYIPNGVGVYDTYTITFDILREAQLFDNSNIPVVFADGYGLVVLLSHSSGTIASRPSASSSYLLYYATDENKCYFDNGSWIQCSFPIAIVSRNSSVGYYSIDQVFNGFGYIGSTVFALPGVKGLAPAGRNDDGTLNNVKITTNDVCVYTIPGSYTRDFNLCLALNNAIGAYSYEYNPTRNKIYRTDTGAEYNNDRFIYGKMHTEKSVITDFSMKTVFHATDYNDLEQKQDKATAVNYSNITNCLTEIPQDVKLELSSGVLTLKAGSKIYVPNGFESDGTTPKFETIITQTDLTNQPIPQANTCFIRYNLDGYLFCDWAISTFASGSSVPSGYSGWFYNTSINTIRYYTNGVIDAPEQASLPLGIVTNNSNSVASIDQIFNGFGYIGSTVFALPGVKGLAPAGRNADGTLNNNEYAVTSVNCATLPSDYSYNDVEFGFRDNTSWLSYYTYNEIENRNYIGNIQINRGMNCVISAVNGVITKFSPKKTAFRAVDYNDFEQKQDKATAVNYDNISNCLTEIPQDIKLELNNGTLTLKSGSKVYVPNGSGVYDVKTISSDISMEEITYNTTYLLFTNADATFLFAEYRSSCSSGTTQPSGTWKTWYDTTNNKIKRFGNTEGTVLYEGSLPIAIVTVSGGVISSIDQVFNGFGYIGSTIFALPGVKGLTPYGKNADGSLNNIPFELTTVCTSSILNLSGKVYYLRLMNNYFGMFPISTYYDQNSNYIIYNNTVQLQMIAGKIFINNDTITDFIPKTTFQSLDYGDKSVIAGWGMPGNKYIDLTVGVSGTAYTAPTNGYFYANINTDTSNFHYVTLHCGDFGDTFFTTTNGLLSIFKYLPALKGSFVILDYGGVTFNCFRFVYAEGES